MSEKPPPPPITPLVDWFSRHGVKVFVVLVIIELAFHAWAISTVRK